MPDFDVKGYLKPDKGILITHEEFRALFVEGLPGAIWRLRLMETYESFLAEFMSLEEMEIEVWVDGSFTNRNRVPRDLDLLVIAEEALFMAHEAAIEEITELYRATHLDLYFLKQVPPEHPKRTWFEGDRAYWMHLFTHDPRNKRHRRPIRKGFIIIRYATAPDA